MPAAAEVTWRLLQDIEAVATCMPGAAITERVDDTHFKGTVAVKVGPASLKFRGEIEVKALDSASRTLRLVASGTDQSGTSAASLDLTARAEAVDTASSNLVGKSDASVSGKAATFGGRMMDAVSDQILKQFAANFAAKVAALAPPPVAVAPVAESAPVPPVAPPAPTPQPQALDGLALLWSIVKDWLRGLFSKKTA